MRLKKIASSFDKGINILSGSSKMSLQDFLVESEKCNSIFEKNVRNLTIPVIGEFTNSGTLAPISFQTMGKKLATKDSEQVAKSFPNVVGQGKNEVLSSSGINLNPAQGKRIAVLFSGGPAAGGHNVVCGLKKIIGENNTLFGVKAGPKGLIEGNLFEISDADIDRIQNTGGFDFLGSDRTKIKTEEQFLAVKNTCKNNQLDAIIIVGGDDSNTNAAVLAEYLYSEGVQVIGVPKTIDGDLQVNDLLPISFGFDTATKIYAEMVGNILQDTPSSRKYWHFVKVMGRSASHVALEVALQVKPAITLISEEIKEKNISLADIVDNIASTVVKRSKKGINHGVVLIPEGVIEFIPEMTSLIQELNEKVSEFKEQLANKKSKEEKRDFIYSKLTAEHTKLMASLPDYIEDMLLADRDSHGNLQVSLIPTEKLFIDMVAEKVKELDSSVKFNTLNHFFGYEGRCGAPTLFDAAYTFNLGLVAGSLVLSGKTGYMAAVSNLDDQGNALAIPLTGLINLERRHGKDEMVIEKALVDINSPAFMFFESRRDQWASEDLFSSPGPRQLWGPVAKQLPISVALNRGYSKLGFNWE